MAKLSDKEKTKRADARAKERQQKRLRKISDEYIAKFHAGIRSLMHLMGTREYREVIPAHILKLKPLDRQIIISYLEGMDAASIADITGLTPANIAMKIHRIKKILAHRIREEQSHA